MLSKAPAFSLACSATEDYHIVDKALVIQQFKQASLETSKLAQLPSVHTMKSVYFSFALIR